MRPTNRGRRIILITTYRIHPFLSREDEKELLEVFGQEGPGPGTSAHYVAADGSHGVVISEPTMSPAATATSRTTPQWVEYDSRVMLKIEEAVPLIMDALG